MPQQQAERPAHQHRRHEIGGEPDALHQQIGDQRPVMAEKIARRRIDRRIERDIAGLYLADYQRIWDGVVADIGLAKFRDMNAAAEALSTL